MSAEERQIHSGNGQHEKDEALPTV